jgi:hypothetical protein
LQVKGLNAKDMHKETFSDYGGKRLSLKAVQNWVEKHGKHFTDDKEFETGERKGLRQQSEYCCFNFFWDTR